MISVIVYGRNDSHGYNLHKRASLFFNTLSELLTDSNDEIVFADCNSPEGLPTFPEVIQDILTPAAREKIRVIRIPSQLFRKQFPHSQIQAVEAFSRNVALRRTRDENHWVLSTNTDMIFNLKNGKKSLSNLVKNLTDHHYLLPRFNIPEWLWESLDRLDITSSVKSIETWATRFHLKEICTHYADIAFDSPGDFQLAPRNHYFSIQGFDENMHRGWHVDANLCRRLFLKYGVPKTLKNDLEGFHLNHNLQANLLHTHDLENNDFTKFYSQCSQAEILSQSESWGLNGILLEEIHLPSHRYSVFDFALNKALPNPLVAPKISDSSGDTFNKNLFYDTSHVIPYLANLLAALESSSTITYWGINISLLTAINQFLVSFGYSNPILISQELCRLKPELKSFGEAVIFEQLETRGTIFILDFHLGSLFSEPLATELSGLFSNIQLKTFCQSILLGIKEFVLREKRCISQGNVPRKFIFLGHQNTEYESFLSSLFRMILGPFNDHVHYGIVAINEKIKPSPILLEKASWIPTKIKRNIGFNIIGYLTTSTGLGVAARNTTRLLRKLGYEVALLDIDGGLNRSGKENEFSDLLVSPTSQLPYEINIFHFNPAEVGTFLRQNHPAVVLTGHMNICIPFWELARIPGNWLPVLESMDIVLAPTHFIENAIAASVSRAGVRYYPQSIESFSEVVENRKRWGIPESALVFGFSFDFTSVFERKNPLAVIQAFIKAFCNRNDVYLVIKMNHAKVLPAYSQIAEKLELMRNENSNLIFINESLPYSQVIELMACWDVYVSLHRAEGLGLGLMESMSMGKAVMATAWSGNMDYMHDGNSVLVGYKLIGVDPNSLYNFCLNGETNHVWAEPDIEDASIWMRRLADDANLRQKLGVKAREDMHSRRELVDRGDVFVNVLQFHEQWKYRRELIKTKFRPKHTGLKVLFQNRPTALIAPGGDTVVMHQYKRYLEQCGVLVDMIHDDSAEPSNYDLVHLFNLVLPQTIEPLARRVLQTKTPFIVEAFQENQAFYLSRSFAMYRLLLAYMQRGQDRAFLPKLMELMKMSGPMVSDTSAFTANNADVVVVSSQEEASYLHSLHPESKIEICMHGSEVADLYVGPEVFEKEFGVKDFVLCVGRLEPRKNQLALLVALEHEEIPIVFADGGICYNPDYAHVCRQFRRQGKTIYTGRLSHELLVSAYRAARVHVLPSWYELPGLVTLEAALYGCNVAATPHGGIKEYMGDTCRYFEPGDIEGIRMATLQAWQEPKSGSAREVARRWTWDRSGEQIYRLYQKILQGKRQFTNNLVSS